MELGERIGRALPPGAVVLLSGDLGAGKTTIAKGIVAAVGGADADEVSSPTFSLIHEYRAAARVYHVDLYRLEEAREVEALGLDELFDGQAVVLVEWGERFPQLLPPERIEIRLEHAGDDERIITVSGIQP